MASTVDPLDLINIEQRLFTLEANTNKFNLNRSENLRRMQEQTKNCYTEIRSFRKDINTFLDKIEQAFCQELWSLEVEQKDNILYVVRELEKVNHAVITLKATLREIKNSASNAYNESLEKLKKELCKNENSVYIKLFNSSGGRELDIDISFNPELQTLTSKIQSLGDVYIARGPTRIEFDEKNTFMVDTEMTKESQSKKNDREDGNKEEGRKDVSMLIIQSQEHSELICKVKQEPVENCPITTEPLPSNMSVHVSNVTQSQEDSELICKVKQEPVEDCPITTEPLPSNMSVHVSNVTQSHAIPVTCTTPYFIQPLLTSAIHAPIVMPAIVSSAPTMQFPVPIQSGNNRAPATFQLPSGSNVQSSLMAVRQPYLIRFMPIDMNSKIIRRFPLVPVMPASTNAPTCTSTGNQLPVTQLQMALQPIDQLNHPYLSSVNEPGNIQNTVAIQTDSELKQYYQQSVKSEALSPQPWWSPESEQPPSVEELLSEIEKNNEDDQPSTKKRGRFQRMTDEDMEELQETKFESKSTQANTRWGVKMFQEWSVETTGSEVDLESISKEDLNNNLKHFYAEFKPKHQEKRASRMPEKYASVYHKNTFINVRSALNRHLKDLQRNIDIVRDNEFRDSNNMLDSTLKMMTKSGLSRPTQHKDIIEMDDLKKIRDYIYQKSCTPVILRLRVWYFLSIHFVSRGLKFHQQLLKDSFDFLKDTNGDEYVVINHKTQQNNVHGGETSEKGPVNERMYAIHGHKSCPVAALRLFIKKTAPEAKSLFNRCVKDNIVNLDFESVNVWYTAQSLSSRFFSNFMSDISRNAKCSKLYTAQSLRATAIQAMNDADHELLHLMFMRGHKT